MEIFKIIAFTIVTLVLIVILKSIKRDDFALIVTIISSIIIFILILLKLEDVISLLEDLIAKSGVNKDYLTLLLKVTGISYIIELTTNICKDAGSMSMATKVEMAGKISIVIITIPVLTSVISLVLQIL